MKLNFLPAALEQAKSDAAGPDAVAAGLARAVLEAAGGQAGARFTFRRALAQAESAAQPGPELRRQVAAAVICQEFAAVAPLLAGAFPGLDAHLRPAGAETAGMPPDVLPFEITRGGHVVFDLPDSLCSSPHLPHLIGRWLGALPVFAACAAAGQAHTGRSVLNVGARQKLPGVAYCGNRPAAWLIPDPDFLATEGHARLRRQMLAPDWADRSDRVFWRGGAPVGPAPAARGPAPGCWPPWGSRMRCCPTIPAPMHRQSPATAAWRSIPTPWPPRRRRCSSSC